MRKEKILKKIRNLSKKVFKTTDKLNLNKIKILIREKIRMIVLMEIEEKVEDWTIWTMKDKIYQRQGFTTQIERVTKLSDTKAKVTKTRATRVKMKTRAKIGCNM
jgi:hypothetical protein